VREAAATIGARLGGPAPAVAVVLGSGLGRLAAEVRDAVRIPYGEIPHFPPTTVAGHAGELLAGTLAGRAVLVQSGRAHVYEGHPAAAAALPVRALAALGVRTLVLTCAAGGIRRTFAGGTVMLVADHLNLTFRNPLIGPVLPGEERFPDMSDPYDAGLRRLAREAARARGFGLEEGVYAGVLGPSYETPAEVRMLERLGADAVGMSTVLEVIAARALGLRCLAVAAITNLAAGLAPGRLDHRDVLAAAERVAGEVGAVVSGVLEALPE
jgi:purine-nucleoside phosphorylase